MVGVPAFEVFGKMLGRQLSRIHSAYDAFFDAATRQLVMECREPDLSGITRLLRFTEYQRCTPFEDDSRFGDVH